MEKHFIRRFSLKFAIPLLESNLKILFARKNGFVGSQCLNHVIKMIKYATRIEKTMNWLKPHVEQLLFDTLIPIMFVTSRDIEMFDDDPVGYIREVYDYT